MEVERWKWKDGSGKMEVGRWKWEDGSGKMGAGRGKMEVASVTIKITIFKNIN